MPPRPLCQCRVDWLCLRCVKCLACCTCHSADQRPSHVNTKDALLAFKRLRETPVSSPSSSQA
jgi:hypothetical protein